MLAVSTGSLYAQTPAPAPNNTILLPLILKQVGVSSGGGATHTGEATYYGADGGGNCSFDPTPQDLMVGAMNQTDYANSAICGAYVELTGPNGTITIRIVDRCPECPAGNIDLSQQAFARIAELVKGRVPITWRIVSPEISGPIRYRFKEGSSQWWTAVQIRNHRNPIAKVEYLDKNGQFKTVPRMEYNYFVESSGMGPGPYTFRVTDSYGNVLTDSGIALKVAGEVAGTGQFPKAP
jgi:expansin (peptidoglycan-binding protein)